jgi:hypothetical protein
VNELAFVVYRPKKDDQLVIGAISSGDLQPVFDAFINKRLTRGKEVNATSDIKPGQVGLDLETGNLLLASAAGAKWGRPSCGCPDCSGQLELRKKYFSIGSPASPWFYRCTNHENGCKTVFASNIGGDIVGDLPNAETRRARKLTSEVFDTLWEGLPEVLAWDGNRETMNAVKNKAKARCYRFLAAKMKDLGHEEGNIQKMDIPTLRVAYAICRDAKTEDVLKVSA